jgi:hypothetical protein
MKKPINQNLLVICKYHSATDKTGSRVSYRLSIPDSKKIVNGFDHYFNNEQEMVASWIKYDTKKKPLSMVQMPKRGEVGLIYNWSTELIEHFQK